MVRLRRATLGDCAEILEVYRPYVESTSVSFELVTPSEDEFEARMRGIMSHFPYLVAEEDGEIVGYAYAHYAFERAAYRFCAELSVYVRRGRTRGGVGSALYAALIPILREQGFHALYGILGLPNDPSDALHRRFGFHEAATFERQGYKFGEWHGVRWWELRLCEDGAEPRETEAFSALSDEFVERTLREAEREYLTRED